MRYMLGNLHDFDPMEDLLPYESLLPQDRYMLHLLYEFGQQVTVLRDIVIVVATITSVSITIIIIFINVHAAYAV